MTIKQKKINIFKALAVKLHNQSLIFFRRAFNLKPEKTSRAMIRAFLAGRGMPLDKVWFADHDYYYVTIEEMKDIILHDWVDKKKYLSEKFDCDDFALVFKAHLAERFNINAVGLARSVKINDLKTGKPKGFHRANIFFADDNGVIKLYFLEPQTDKVVQIWGYNELIKLTGWTNQLNVFDF